jgi:diguanylate cyclase (GGDEF)-like protein
MSGIERDNEDLIERLLDTAARLKSGSESSSISPHLVQLVHDYQSSRAQLDRTYASLIRLLLEQAESGANFPPTPGEKTLRAGDALASPARYVDEAESDSIYPSLPETSMSVELSRPERRINTSYRLHLDRKRDEIEKLQETLAKGIREAIVQNRDFGALLKVELSALRQAQKEEDVRALHRILIDGLEELINNQRLLETKLNRTGDYLNLVKADGEQLRSELQKVRLLSLTDEFTGLPNRRAFMRHLQEEIGRVQRYGTPLALALLDLDHFKSVNDTYGHKGGDEVLRCYATEILSVLRRHDLVARYGGEEFAVMLPNTVENGAFAAINKARQRAQEVRCQIGDDTIPLPTFSAGIAMYRDGESPNDLIERADRALYAAKRLGRNRIEFALDVLTPDSPDVGVEPKETV